MIVCFGVSTQSFAQLCTTVPVINSFSPNTGFIGSKVTIFGANFDPNTISNNVVYFGSTKATVTSATFGQLEVIVPVGASTAPISVTNQCKRTAYSAVSFNGIFCPTPLSNQSYNNRSFDLTGVYGAYNMISVDLDLDGKPEVISSSNGGYLSIAVNKSIPGSLSFTAINSDAGGQSIYAADFDGDGLKDLLSTYKVSRNISTPGNVSIAPYQTIPAVSSYQIAAGDFNNDGKIDIIGGNGGGVYVAFNTSTGTGSISFGPAQLFANVQTQCTGIQVADIDGDGKTDFIASQGNSNRAVSIRNTTTVGSMTPSSEAPEYWSSDSNPADGTGTYPYRAQVADFDKDGKIDFTSCNFYGDANVAIWRNISTVGDIVFAPTVNLPSPVSNYRIGVGDVDGDGYPDVVTKSNTTNVFSVYKNTSTGPGAPTFATRIDYTSSWQAEVSGIVIGDLDGDFVPDIATSGINSNRILFHRNTSSQVDITPPTAIAQNVVVALAPNGTATVAASQVNNGSSDACGIKSITLSPTLFTCANIGANSVTLTVTDNSGNVTTASATVNVQAAAIIVSGQTTVCQGGVIPLTANVGDSYQWYKNSVLIGGATLRNYTATQTGSYTVAVTNSGGCSGTSLPTVLTVNENPTVNILEGNSVFLCSGTAKLTASQSSIYQWMNNGVDIANATQQIYNANTAGNYSVRVIDLFGCSAVSSTVVVSNGPKIGISEGTILISNNSLSDFGNVLPNTNNVKTFTIKNTGSNALTVSQISISGVSAQYFSISGAPTSVAANSSANFSLVFNAPNITNYNASVTVLNNDCDKAITIFNVKAKITCVAAAVIAPANMVVNTDGNNCSATATYIATFAGAPVPNVTYSFSGATTGSGQGIGSGSIFNSGVTTVTINAINACGNASQSFTITVIDDIKPVVLVQNQTIQLDANGVATITAADINNGSTDNCGIATVVLSETAFDCTNVGANTVILTITDINGNVSSNTATVTVEDMIAPIVLTQNKTIQLDANGVATITAADINNGSTDNCSIETIVLSKTAFLTENLGVNTVTLTITDIYGNVSSLTATVTVEDHIAPIITVPATLTISCGASLLPSNTGMATATDNSTKPTDIFITYTDSTLPDVCGGNFTRTWTATDASNNGSSSEQIISVNPADLPTMIAPNSVTISVACGEELQPSTLPFTNGLSDACLLSGTSLNSTFALVENTSGGTYIETWTANDVCGRALASVSRTVTVSQNLGSVESFVFFSVEGAVGNTGVSTITGDIGTNVGAITGFASPSTVSGTTSHANATTTQAKKDLLNLYIHLSNIPVTVITHGPVFGNGETLNAGVYSIGAAGSLVGTLTLDGQNNPNALFIFKYVGAFSAAANSKLILTNGLKAANVFWVAEGAISIGASSVMKGNLIAHTGAVSMGAGGDLEGRMLSTTGAVTFDSGNAYLPSDLSMIPIISITSSLNSDALLGSVAKFALFSGAGAVSNLAISGIIGDVGTNAGAITGFETSDNTLINDIHLANGVTEQAKTDLMNAYQQLIIMPGISLTPTLAGLTLTPGVYTVSGAGTLTNTITLDGQGNPNAKFVIKFEGGFSTGAQSKVSLINGARSCNVFWVSEGAIAMGASSFMKGNLIAHNGAVSMGARGNIEGRMLSTSGAISFNTAVAYISYLKCVGNVISYNSVTAVEQSLAARIANTQIELEATEMIAYPNPFAQQTKVRFTLPYQEDHAVLDIYDLRGIKIKSLFNGHANAQITYEVQFNGEYISAGTYILKLTTSKEVKILKVIMED